MNYTTKDIENYSDYFTLLKALADTREAISDQLYDIWKEHSDDPKEEREELREFIFDILNDIDSKALVLN